MIEERIVNHLKAIALGYPPFKIELKDFGSYPTHRIFINVISKIPIQTLTRKIRSEVGRLMKLNDENKPHFFTDPLIHVASKLLPWHMKKDG
jgi:2'-5' RNA ligase